MTGAPQPDLEGAHLAVVDLGGPAVAVADRVARRLDLRWYLGALDRHHLAGDAGHDDVVAAAGGARVVLVTGGRWPGATGAGWVLVDASDGDPGELARLAEDALLGGSPAGPAPQSDGPVVDGPGADGPVCAC